MYYCDVSEIHGTVLVNNDTVHAPEVGGDQAHMYIVKETIGYFTQRQVDAAATCRIFQNSAGLTTAGIIAVVDKRMLNNSPITRESIKHALSIWGPSAPYLDGKTTRRRADAVILNVESITTIPPHILRNHPVVNLGMDVVMVNRIPFVSTISRVIKLGTAT